MNLVLFYLIVPEFMHCLKYAAYINLYVNNNHPKGKIDI